MGAETYYQGLTNGYINLAGMRTVEQYLIKAECLARKNQLTDAGMDVPPMRCERHISFQRNISHYRCPFCGRSYPVYTSS